MPIKELWWVPLVSGIQDGINPCLLVTAAVFLLFLRRFRSSNKKVLAVTTFLLSLFLVKSIVDFGLVENFVLNNYFYTISKLIYAFIAIVLFYFAIRDFLEWYKISKTGSSCRPKDLIVLNPLKVTFCSVSLGMILGGLASIWPVNYYISVINTYLFLPGDTFFMILVILSYVLLSLWFVWLMFVVDKIYFKNLKLYSLISSAVCFSASIGVIDLFL